MRRGSFPDFTAFSADAFWKSGEYFSLLSDQRGRLDLSCISASLFTPYLYTTFEMASRFGLFLFKNFCTLFCVFFHIFSSFSICVLSGCILDSSANPILREICTPFLSKSVLFEKPS